MSSPAVCDSKSPREMATDLNLQGNGHHSDTLTLDTPLVLKCILCSLSYHHMHILVLYSLNLCVILSFSDASLLRLLCCSLYSVPGHHQRCLIGVVCLVSLSHCQGYMPVPVYSISPLMTEVSHCNNKKASCQDTQPQWRMAKTTLSRDQIYKPAVLNTSRPPL